MTMQFNATAHAELARLQMQVAQQDQCMQKMQQFLLQQPSPPKRGKAKLRPGETLEKWLESLGTLPRMSLTLLGSLTYPSLDSLWQATIPRRRLHTQRR